MRDVLTAQNRQPRVQVSPINMMVAVAFDLSDPPQHSPMFGHLASSHTVCRPNPRKSFLILLKFCDVGMFVLSQSGNFVCAFFEVCFSCIAYSSDAESVGGRDKKSSKDGPWFSAFVNVVGARLEYERREDPAGRTHARSDRDMPGKSFLNTSYLVKPLSMCTIEVHSSAPLQHRPF